MKVFKATGRVKAPFLKTTTTNKRANILVDVVLGNIVITKFLTSLKELKVKSRTENRKNFC